MKIKLDIVKEDVGLIIIYDLNIFYIGAILNNSEIFCKMFNFLYYFVSFAVDL